MIERLKTVYFDRHSGRCQDDGHKETQPLLDWLDAGWKVIDGRDVNFYPFSRELTLYFPLVVEEETAVVKDVGLGWYGG